MLRRLARTCSLCLLSGCGTDPPPSRPSPAAPSESPADSSPASNGRSPATAPVSAAECTIDLDTSTGRLRINGVSLRDHRIATLRRILGRPDRVEDVKTMARYEEFGGDDAPPSSDMVDTTTRYYVYDQLGLVSRTDGAGSPGSPKVDPEPTTLLLFFPHERRFTNTAAPAVAPARRGACALALDGRVLDPAADVLPPGTTHETETFDVHGRAFGSTSIGGQIDSIYGWDPAPAVQIYLDDASTRRPSYAEIRL